MAHTTANKSLLGGKYHIIAELGRGGMGVVYKARQENLDRTVAIKCLSRDLRENKEFFERFNQEARIIARMGNHENVVSVYDIEEYEGDKYIIMEFIEGESLGDRVKRVGRLPATEAIHIVRQTAKALHHAHKLGIIHRDIKPDNIMLMRGDRVKVMDFGIARVQDSKVKTQTGLSIGTPHYMSPEQIEGKGHLDARSDVYSLAVVLYYIVCGQLPFDDSNPFSLAMKHISSPPPPPSHIYPAIHPHLEAIILKGMAKSPDDRFASGEAFEESLAAFMASGASTKTGLQAYTQGSAIPGVTSGVQIPTAAGNAYTPTAAQRYGEAPTMLAQTGVHEQKRSLLAIFAWTVIGGFVLLVGGGAALWYGKPDVAKGLLATVGLGHLAGTSGQTTVPFDQARFDADMKQLDRALELRDTALARQMLDAARVKYGEHAGLRDYAERVERLRLDTEVKPLAESEVREIETAIGEARLDKQRLASVGTRLEKVMASSPTDSRLAALAEMLKVQRDRADLLDKTRVELKPYLDKEDFGSARLHVERAGNVIKDDIELNSLLAMIDGAENRAIQKLRRSIDDALTAEKVEEARHLISDGRVKYPDQASEWLEFDRRATTILQRAQSEEVDRERAQALRKELDESLAANDIENARMIAMRLRTEYGRMFSEDFEKMVEEKVKTASAELYRQGREAEEIQGNLEGALAFYEKAQQISPNNSQYFDAVIQVRKKLQLKADFANHMKAGDDARTAGNLLKAKDAYNLALVVDPFSAEARRNLAVVDEMLRQAATAKVPTETGISDPPDVIERRKRQAPSGMIYIPGGSYRVGSDKGEPNAAPEHIVRVNGFYIAQAEVTVEQYEAFTKRDPEGHVFPNLPPGDRRPELPITRVSQSEAESFCRLYGFRLPTEFEWEIAARTQAAREFPVGNTWNPKRANYGDNGTNDGFSGLAPAERSFADGWSDDGYRDGTRTLFNMTGNVAEWTSSTFTAYPGGDATNPEFERGLSVIRGGSFEDANIDRMKGHFRRPQRGSFKFPNVGFRVVKDPSS